MKKSERKAAKESEWQKTVCQAERDIAEPML